MSFFTVNEVIDGDTFSVAEGWSWEGQTGVFVRIAGYKAPEVHTPDGHLAKNILRRLLLDQKVDLRSTH